MKPLIIYLSKIALLFIAIGSMAIFYYCVYYKAFDKKCIPQNADVVAILDKKNIRNYLLFSYLKNPSVWKWCGTESEYKKHFDFSNFGVKTPDYLAFFHIENQSISQWFISLEIDDETVFQDVMAKKHFCKTKLQNGMNSYYSKRMSLFIVKHSNQILVSNISENQKKTAVKVAEDLFLKRLFLKTKKIEKVIGTSNAASIWIKKNSQLEEDGIVNINLNEQEIVADGHLKLKHKKEWQFSQNPDALLSLGFDFEMIQGQNILKHNSVKINKMIGFDLDSILAKNPTKIELLLNEIVEKKDSAISYDYDDDFNPIKKVVVQSRREPSFYFSIQTANSKKVYNYLKSQKAIDNNSVFVNFPLAKTKTSIQNNALTLKANPLQDKNFPASVPKIGFFKIQFSKFDSTDWHFLIAKNKNFSILKRFKTLEMELTREPNYVRFQAHLKTKEIKLIALLK